MQTSQNFHARAVDTVLCDWKRCCCLAVIHGALLLQLQVYQNITQATETNRRWPLFENKWMLRYWPYLICLCRFDTYLIIASSFKQWKKGGEKLWSAQWFEWLSVLVILGGKPNKKDGCACCPAGSSHLPAAHISFSGNSTHTDTCTFPYWQGKGEEEEEGW